MTNPDPVESSAVSVGSWRWHAKAVVRLSTALVALVFTAYCIRWVFAHFGFLFDPRLQNDDARTALFPFHRYGMNPWLANDPIAREMLAYVTPGLFALYRVLVPLTNLYVSSKIVQGLAFAILAVAGTLLARTRRAGLAAGLLLVFLVLSDPYAIGRMAGGHARSFAFPCFALWAAGVLTKRRSARVAAPLIGSLFYPAVMLMILAAEGFYTLRQFWRLPLGIVARRIRRACLLALACGVLSLPSVIGGDASRGPIHTLAQAQSDPAFYSHGRLWVLPLGDPARELSEAFLARFMASGRLMFGGTASPAFTTSAAIALSLLGVLVWLRFRRKFEFSDSIAAFLLGSLTLYFASRAFAFRLYSTERYYAYCMRMASCLFLVAVTSRLAVRSRSARVLARNTLAATMMLGQWVFLGDGIVGNNGMTLDARWDADLYGFIRTLPANARFASHPMDGDGIPFYAARATIGTFETLQPWFVDSWKRQKAREYSTLEMLYAENLEDVVNYGRKFSVTHVLINRERYGHDFADRGASFEPFTTYLANSLHSPSRKRPALASTPGSAIVFERPPWAIIDLGRLQLEREAAPKLPR